MSLKGQLFHKFLPQPQVSSNFNIVIPGILDSPVRCFSASMPSEVRHEYQISVSGENIYLPGKSQVPGEWVCKLYESTLMDIGVQLEVLKAIEVTEVQGVPVNLNMHDVFIFLTNDQNIPIFTKVLRYAWISSVSAVSLDYGQPNSPMVYEVHFRYSFVDRLV